MVFEKLSQLIAEHFSIDVEDITMDTNFMEDLNADSIDLMELMMAAEETFGMTAMEARCCGTEAIVYKDTACEEIVNQFGGIAVPKGPEHLLEAIEKLTKEETA